MANCNNSCNRCARRCNCGNSSNNRCEFRRIRPRDDDLEASRRVCCDQDGTCHIVSADCRNRFWPEFSHPRWLCCKDLYCAGCPRP